MKRWNSWFLWACWTVLLLFALLRWKEFGSSLRIGIALGLGAIPLVVLPLILRGHEKRLAKLEADPREKA
jgi:hypothetical protein